MRTKPEVWLASHQEDMEVSITISSQQSRIPEFGCDLHPEKGPSQHHVNTISCFACACVSHPVQHICQVSSREAMCQVLRRFRISKTLASGNLQSWQEWEQISYHVIKDQPLTFQQIFPLRHQNRNVREATCTQKFFFLIET